MKCTMLTCLSFRIRNAYYLLPMIAAILMLTQACRKSSNLSGIQVSSEAVVGLGTFQPNPTFSPIQFRAYAQLSLNRSNVAAVACRSKVFFAGGLINKVDIYIANLDKWYQQTLQLPRRVCASTGKTLMVGGDGVTVQVYNIKE